MLNLKEKRTETGSARGVEKAGHEVDGQHVDCRGVKWRTCAVYFWLLEQ